MESRICVMNPTVRDLRICIELRRDVNANVIMNQSAEAYTAAGHLWCDYAGAG